MSRQKPRPIDIEIYDPSGNVVAKSYFDQQSFAAGQSRTYAVIGSFFAPGTYTVKIAITCPGGGPLYALNDHALQFTVQ